MVLFKIISHISLHFPYFIYFFQLIPNFFVRPQESPMILELTTIQVCKVDNIRNKPVWSHLQ